MEIERHKKLLGPAKAIELCYLLLLLFVCWVIAYVGLGGEFSGKPIISSDPNAAPLMKVNEPVFLAGAIALLIAISNVWFAKVRQHQQEIIQLEVSRFADERQQREWTRQAEMADNQREGYSEKLVAGLGNELTVVKTLYQGMLEALPLWNEQDSNQKRNNDTKRFFAGYSNFAPSRPIFDAIGLTLVDLPEHCINAVIRYQNQYAALHGKIKQHTSNANYFSASACREVTVALIDLIGTYQSELQAAEANVASGA